MISPTSFRFTDDPEAVRQLAERGEEAIKKAEESDDLVMVSRALLARRLLSSRPPVSHTRPVQTPELIKGEGNVVVIEDDDTLRKLTKMMVTRLGYRAEVFVGSKDVLSFFRGESTRTQFEPNEVDLVISDIGLYGMDGRNLAEELKKMRPGIKILFVSGLPADDHGINTNSQAYLQKPFRHIELAEKLKQLLGDPEDCKSH